MSLTRYIFFLKKISKRVPYLNFLHPISGSQTGAYLQQGRVLVRWLHFLEVDILESIQWLAWRQECRATMSRHNTWDSYKMYFSNSKWLSPENFTESPTWHAGEWKHVVIFILRVALKLL